jgi:predicted transcriptional regulator
MLQRKQGVTVAEIAASEIHTEGATTSQYNLILGQLLKAGLARREKDGAAFRYYAAL